MVGKIYFIIIVVLILLANRYQYVTTASYGVFDALFLVRDGLLILGGFCYFFQKTLIDKTYWKYIWWFLVAQVILSIVQQILPGSYYGNLADGQILVNIFVILFVMSFYIPLYVAAFKLQNIQRVSHKKKSKRK